MDHRGEYGKPDAGKLACPVWSRGKAVRPYLLLPLARREGGARCEGKCIARDVTQDVNSL